MYAPIRIFVYTLAGALAMGAAALVADLVLYQVFILPRLPGLDSISVEWWVILLFPLAISLLLLGYASGSFGSALASASGGTIGLMAYEFVFAHLNQPGHLKSLAIEDPVYFFTTGTAIRFTIVLIAVLVGFLGRRVVHGATPASI